MIEKSTVNNGQLLRAFAGSDRLCRPGARSGFTLIEIMIVLVIVVVISATAMPFYIGYVERTKVAQAKADIADMEGPIAEYAVDNRAFPPTLAAIGKGGLLDPWGNPYVYADQATISPGQRRKDQFLVPINSDYDLYSKGPDGNSQPPLTAASSRDDIVRANNGRFIGIAADY